MEIKLIRHGEMAGDPFICPAPGVSGCLSKKGIEDAQKARLALSSTKLTHIFSSPYGRALQTAEIATEGKGLDIEILDYIFEWQPNRQLEVLPSTEATKIRDAYANIPLDEMWKTELGEGTFEMLHRIGPPFLKRLAKLGLKRELSFFRKATELPEETSIAVFAHGGSLNILAGFLLNLPILPTGFFSFDHAGILTIKFDKAKDVYLPKIHCPAFR